MITIKTGSVQGMINALYAAADIPKGQQGSILTWDCIEHEGKRWFTHNPDQWNRKAWFLPVITPNTTDELIFKIMAPNGTRIAPVTYSVYHGRFIEMLFAHLPTAFISALATSLPVQGQDVV